MTTGSTPRAPRASTAPLAHLSVDLDELRAAHLYRPLRVMSTANRTRVTVDGRDVDHPRLQQLPRAEHPPPPRRGRRGGDPALRRRLRRRPHDLRDDDPPRGARGGAGRVQARRGGAHLPVRLHLQHRRHPGRRRRAGPDRLGRAQPRLDHRRDAPQQGAAGDLPPQGRGAPPRAPRDRPPRRPAGRRSPTGRSSSSPTASSAWTATSRRFPAIVEAAEEHDAAVFVDDAHASGVLGRNGRGTVDHFDLHGRVAIQVGHAQQGDGRPRRLRRRARSSCARCSSSAAGRSSSPPRTRRRSRPPASPRSASSRTSPS